MLVTNQIVDRQHVCASNLTVARAIVRAIKGGYRGWRKVPRHLRRKILRSAFKRHRENRRLYAYVMGGLHSGY